MAPCRQCVLINSQDLVRVLGRLAKDIPHTLHDASLLHVACRLALFFLCSQFDVKYYMSEVFMQQYGQEFQLSLCVIIFGRLNS